jgi:hypothetical protein
MPTLVALRQLSGNYSQNRNGNPLLRFTAPGEIFTTDEETALYLEAKGLAVLYRPPVVEAPAPSMIARDVPLEIPAISTDWRDKLRTSRPEFRGGGRQQRRRR